MKNTFSFGKFRNAHIGLHTSLFFVLVILIISSATNSTPHPYLTLEQSIIWAAAGAAALFGVYQARLKRMVAVELNI